MHSLTSKHGTAVWLLEDLNVRDVLHEQLTAILDAMTIHQQIQRGFQPQYLAC